jgi:hypothetical protein
MCGAEGVDNVDGVGKEYAHALLTGGIAECRGEMGFADYAASGIVGTMPGTGLCRVGFLFFPRTGF